MAAALVRLKIEDMSLDDTGVTLDFDFPALLAQEGGLIAVLRKKQPHFITGTAVGAGTQDRKLNHPAGVILKTLHGKNVVSFQLTGGHIPHRRLLSSFLISLAFFLPLFQQLDNGFLHPLRCVALGKILPQSVRGECHLVQIAFLFLAHNSSHHING